MKKAYCASCGAELEFVPEDLLYWCHNCDGQALFFDLKEVA